MTLVDVNGAPVGTFQELAERVAASEGREVVTTWREDDGRDRDRHGIHGADGGAGAGARRVVATMKLRPELISMTVPAGTGGDDRPERANGLFGLVPLVRIGGVGDESPNRELLRPGDVVLAIGPAGASALEGRISAPRAADFLRTVQSHRDGRVALRLLRDGRELEVEGTVNRHGQLGITMAPALETPMIARPVDRVEVDEAVGPTPVAALGLLGETRIVSVDGAAVADWIDLWTAMRSATASAAASGDGAAVSIDVVAPTPGAARETVSLRLSAADVARLQSLRWLPPADDGLFDPVSTLLTADGNPLRAVAMGMRETRKMIVMTYLTIVRLFQRTVGVEQLRGPVGIVHMGAAVVEHGWTYALFFLAMISVNLAVLNFLPLPIVDGGLFLYLVYEKVRGRPPSLAFQNAATVVGLCLIGGLFIVTFYNDVMRLIG
ncbi:MAG: RIP metalloprotease [Phycisphaerales bacterium]